MAMIDAIELTEADSLRWRHMDNDSGRRAMKHVSVQSTERLLDCLRFARDGDFDYNAGPFVALLSELGPSTNPMWLSARIANELYDRGQIDERKLDMVMA